jgi:hypothetical protein
MVSDSWWTNSVLFNWLDVSIYLVARQMVMFCAG